MHLLRFFCAALVASVSPIAIANPLLAEPVPAGITVIPPTFDQIEALFNASLTSIPPNNDIQKRQTNFWTVSYTGTFICPTGGSIQRSQSYSYEGLNGHFTGVPHSITNVDRFSVQGNEALMGVYHSFTQYFGQTICCYTMAHGITPNSWDEHPILVDGGGNMSEVCVTMHPGGVVDCSQTAILCNRAGTPSFAYARS